MAQITVEISDDDAANLAELARLCTEAHKEADGATTHGEFASVADVLAMLAEDAAMAIRRPGSWEGSGMLALFHSHGYEL